jgi:hypothetical protein
MIRSPPATRRRKQIRPMEFAPDPFGLPKTRSASARMKSGKRPAPPMVAMKSIGSRLVPSWISPASRFGLRLVRRRWGCGPLFGVRLNCWAQRRCGCFGSTVQRYVRVHPGSVDLRTEAENSGGGCDRGRPGWAASVFETSRLPCGPRTTNTISVNADKVCSLR